MRGVATHLKAFPDMRHAKANLGSHTHILIYLLNIYRLRLVIYFYTYSYMKDAEHYVHTYGLLILSLLLISIPLFAPRNKHLFAKEN